MWLAEHSLWIHWSHVGWAIAGSSSCELVVLENDRFESHMHGELFVQIYALRFFLFCRDNFEFVTDDANDMQEFYHSVCLRTGWSASLGLGSWNRVTFFQIE